MLSLNEARTLLQGARNPDQLRACAAALGFPQFTPLGLDLQEKLGIAGISAGFEISDGPGVTRLLIAHFSEHAPPRDLLTLIARRLSASVPHLLWIVLSADGDSHIGISVWRPDTAAPRVHALLADPRRISDSDAHTFCALTACVGGSDSITHLRWTEILSREAVTIRFFRALRTVIDKLSQSIDGQTAQDSASELALTCVSRLLFLSFVETRGWLNGDHDFLSNTFIQCMASGGSYHRRVLTPLFFGTLNTPVRRRAARAREFGRIPFLNGGLFSRTHLERGNRFEFSDEALGGVYGDLLTRFRFTGREQAVSLVDSAIDPEILGRAFESLMQHDTRKSTGAFYTPQSVVRHVADAALESGLCARGLKASVVTSLLGNTPLSHIDRDAATNAVHDIRIVDPACGSGAFLVYLLEKLADLRELCGDRRPLADRRRDVLAKSIFGVDINPTAVWLCELRLWLSVVIRTDADRIIPLPNLDRNIRIGDSLSAAQSHRPGMNKSQLELIRLRYVQSVGGRKKLLSRALERLERRNAILLAEKALESIAAQRKDVVSAARSRNLFGERTASREHEKLLSSLRHSKKECVQRIADLKSGKALPFSFQTHFTAVFEQGGFDLVVGNPPWVRIHQIARASRESLKDHFELFRSGGWALGAERASAGSGFAHQLDLSALFIERAISITRDGGTIALLLPSKLWKSLAGGSVRALLSRTCELHAVEDYSGAKALFDATAYPSLLIARKGLQPASDQSRGMHATVHRRTEVLHWRMPSAMLPLEQSAGSPWLLIPEEVRAAFDKVASRGVGLSESVFGRPLLGVKTGLNGAFVLEHVDDTGDVSRMRASEGDVLIERSLIRHVIRGDAIAAWSARPGNDRIVWTHGENGVPLQSLPPLAAKWFGGWRRQLTERTDLRGDRFWWRAFRTEAADHSLHRVVWSDIGRTPRAAVIPAGDPAVPLNTCYVVRCKSRTDSHALATLLNSPLLAAWLSLIAEPAQGGYNRYLGWTMALLPVPREWTKARKDLSRIYLRSMNGDPVSPSELFSVTLSAFGLRDSDVEDMMAWTHR